MNSEAYPKTYEHRLIEQIKKWAGNDFIGDDCAVLPNAQLITSDTLVQDTHFRLTCSFYELGWKTVAVNISDIAAMAGVPKYLVINITMPENFSTQQFDELYKGMVDCAKVHNTKIIGGDLTRGSQLVLTATVVGEAQQSGALLRSTAKPGDIVAVTGDFGASAAGLWVISEGIQDFPYCRMRHNKAKTCLQESWMLAKCAGNRAALMDASDGLADALVQLCFASKIGMEVDLDLIPLHEETLKIAKLAAVDVIDWALYGGEDFELVACIPKESWDMLGNGNPFKSIGHVTDSQEVILIRDGKIAQGVDLGKSFKHWDV